MKEAHEQSQSELASKIKDHAESEKLCTKLREELALEKAALEAANAAKAQQETELKAIKEAHEQSQSELASKMEDHAESEKRCTKLREELAEHQSIMQHWPRKWLLQRQR